MGDERYDVFISYAEQDAGWVEGFLLDAFTAAGVSFVHEAAFRLGASRLQEFQRAVTSSDWTVLVLSPAYFANDVVQFVDLMAQHHTTYEPSGWRVIPMMIEEVDLSATPRLRMLTRVTAVDPDDWEPGVARICETIKRPAPPPFEPPRCPYPGMAPFTEDDADDFFGRDAEVADLAERLLLSPLIAVVGPSGSGKSSLVRAGLTRHLTRSRRFGDGGWAFLRIRPGPDPPGALAAAVGPIDGDHAAAVRRALAAAGAERLLLIVDQFEEVFTRAGWRRDAPAHARAASDEEIVGFFADLQSLAGEEACRVVLTVRADFYGELMSTPLWPVLEPTELKLPPMTVEQLRSAIVDPAERVGVYVEPALVERLVGDASGEPGLLPLVQATLVRLWDRGLRRRVLPLEAYESMIVLPLAAYEGPAPTGLQVAMAAHADAALQGLSPDRRRIAERVFLSLVQFGEGRPDVRRQQSEDELRVGGEPAGELAVTLDHLIERRLLTPDAPLEEGGSRRIDLAHEALIGGWPQYREWIGRRRAEEQTRRRLLAKAGEWERLGSGTAALLDEVELREAVAWQRGSYATELGADPRLDAFVAASRQEVERQRAEREEARRRELGAAQALAEEQRRRADAEEARAAEADAAAAAARRQSKVRTRLAAVGALLAVLATAGAAVAWWQKGRADTQERIAVSRQVAAQAAAAAGSRPDTELLLGLESYRLEPTVEARGAVLSAVAAHPRLLAFLHGHASRVTSAAFSPDGATVATAGLDGEVRLFDARSGEALPGSPLRGHDFPVYGLAFSPDGDLNLLATSDDAGFVRLWDYREGRPVGDLVAGGTRTRAIAFNPAAPTLLAVGGADGMIRLWDVAGAPERAGEIAAHGDAEVRSLAFSPDGSVLASGGDDVMVRLWDPATGDPIGEPGGDHTDLVRTVAFHPDPAVPILASAGNDKRLIWWTWNSRLGLQRRVGLDGEVLPPMPGHAQRVFTAAFSPDGSVLATGGEEGTVLLWDSLTGARFRDRFAREVTPLAAHRGGVRAVAFNPAVEPFEAAAPSLVTASNDRTAALWALGARNRIATYLHTAPQAGATANPIFAMARHPTIPQFVAGSEDGTLQRWDAAGPRPLGERMSGHRDAVAAVAYSADGATIASGSADCEIRLWDAATGEQLGAERNGAHNRRVAALEFDPGGRFLLSGGWDGAVVLWDLVGGSSRQLTSVLDAGDAAPGGCADAEEVGPTRRVNDIWFTPDGAWLVVFSNDGRSRVWPWTDEGPGAEATPPGGELVNRPRPDAAGRFGVAPASDEVLVWALPEGWEPLEALGEPTFRFFAPDPLATAFAADATLVSGHLDGVIRVWDLEAGKPVGDPIPTGAAVLAMAGLPELAAVATGGDFQNLALWDLRVDTWIERICPIANRSLAPSELDLFIPDRRYRETCPGRPAPP